MKFDPEKHHRRSIRLNGYDYSKDGLYFVTICTKNRDCILAVIKNIDTNYKKISRSDEDKKIRTGKGKPYPYISSEILS